MVRTFGHRWGSGEFVSKYGQATRKTFILRQAQDERICGFYKLYPKGHTRTNGFVDSTSSTLKGTRGRTDLWKTVRARVPARVEPFGMAHDRPCRRI